MAEHPSTIASDIVEDLPCRKCRYNLRGGDRLGRCPECGELNAHSVDDHCRRLEYVGVPLAHGGKRWVWLLAEGQSLVALTIGLMLFLAFAPVELFALRSVQRQVALGVACSVLVVHWLAVWKLTTPEPQQPSRTRLVTRLCATAYLVGYVVIAWASQSWNREQYGVFMFCAAILAILCGLIASITFYLHVGRIVRRVNVPWMSRQAPFLAVVSAIGWISAFAPELDAPEDSLYQVLSMPSVGLWSTKNVAESVGEVFRYFRPIVLIAATFWIWLAGWNLFVTVLLVRYSRRSFTSGGGQVAREEARPVAVQNAGYSGVGKAGAR